MKILLFNRMAAFVLAVSCMCVLTLGLSGCGGGGGGSGDEIGPAPQTMNGLVLTLYAGGVELLFIRAEGDASVPGGVETGAVTMKINPGETSTVDSSGAATKLRPSYSISGGRYTFSRSGPEAGSVVVTGEGEGRFGPPNGETISIGNIIIGGITPQTANYFRGGYFTRTYEILFGTNGALISGLNVNDFGEGSSYPGISWTGAILRVFGGGAVPNGWKLADSAGVNLPKLYPSALSGQQLTILPTDLSESGIRYEFLESTFTRFSDAEGDFLEKGVGRRQVIPESALGIINYEYQPDKGATNRALIRVFNEMGPALIYNMTFLDFEKGTYVRENGTTGNFEFPFLDQ